MKCKWKTYSIAFSQFIILCLFMAVFTFYVMSNHTAGLGKKIGWCSVTTSLRIHFAMLYKGREGKRSKTVSTSSIPFCWNAWSHVLQILKEEDFFIQVYSYKKSACETGSWTPPRACLSAYPFTTSKSCLFHTQRAMYSYFAHITMPHVIWKI